MKKQSEEKLLRGLSDAISELTPEDAADRLWEQPVQQADPSAWYLDKEKNRRKANWNRPIAGVAAACMAFFLISAFLFQNMASAMVYLDVNPSLVLDVNYRNRVTEARACNPDAEQVLKDLDLRGADLHVALYAILGSMVQRGYLTQTQDTVLVSVQCPNTGRADTLRTQISAQVSEDLEAMIQSGEVLSQQVTAQQAAAAEPDSGFTPGKAAFVEELYKQYPQLEGASLKDHTIDEIVSLLVEEQLDYSDYLEDTLEDLLDEDDRDDDNDDDEDEDDDEDDDPDDEDDDD